MRRPVAVNSYCGWVSSYLMISFARIQVGSGWRGGRQGRARASSSGALTATAASHSKAFRAKEIMTFSFPGLFSPRQSSLSCRHPSIRTLGERLMRSVHIGVLVTVGAAF